MGKKHTELVCILDKRGSMSYLESDTIGGFNTLINNQKEEEGTVLVTTVLFNTNNTILHNRIPLEEVEPLTKKEYSDSGGTALLDAVGRYAQQEDHTNGINNIPYSFMCNYDRWRRKLKLQLHIKKGEKGYKILQREPWLGIHILESTH